MTSDNQENQIHENKQTEQNTNDKPARRPGRPRKNPLKQEAVANLQEEKTIVKSKRQPKMVESSAPETEVKKTRRGRKPVESAEVAPVVLPENEKKSEKTNDYLLEEKISRPRGRRKSIVESTNEQQNLEAIIDADAPKKRGRKAKVQEEKIIEQTSTGKTTENIVESIRNDFENSEELKSKTQSTRRGPRSRKPATQEKSENYKAPISAENNSNNPAFFEDDNSPIQLLPTQLAGTPQYSQNPRQKPNKGLSKNFFKRVPFSNQNKNNQYNSEQMPNGNTQEMYQSHAPSRQKNQKQNHHRQKPYSEPAFDNSSVIAAITGKSLHQESYSYQDDVQEVQPKPQNFRQPNQQKLRAPRPEPVMDENSLLQQTSSQQQRQKTKRPIRKQNTVREDFSEKVGRLPTFAENALESTYTYIPEVEYIQPPVKENKSRRKKSADAQEANKTHDAYQENKSDISRHSEQLKMFVSVQPDEQVEVVLTENGTVVEYFVEMTHHAKIRGNIYKATIHNVDPNLQAAFVNFGAEKNGFLQIDEVHPDYYLNPHMPSKNHRFPLISKVLKPGQEVLVQIVKEPTGSKGAFLTTWISLAGRFLVLTPGQEQFGVSRKVIDPEERTRLRAMLDGLNPGKDMGVIIRTAAANATPEELEADLDYLQRLWIDVVQRAQNVNPITLIHQEVELTQRVVRDYLNEDVREIWTDDEKMAESIHEMATLLYPQKRNMVKLFKEPRQSLLERFTLQKQINEITSREVQLPSGGRVVFDQTEALMAIDINSGKTQNKANFQAMVLQTNIEAAQAIARHLRLRDIGGQIVIDFIELRDKSTIKEVEKAFKDSMKPDRARYEIGHISSFGLLELVRQRIGSSAISISTEPCPHCKGTGIRRNMEWQAQDALKEISRKARAEKSIKYVYSTDKELALYLLNHKRDRIAEIEERLNIRIEINCH